MYEIIYIIYIYISDMYQIVFTIYILDMYEILHVIYTYIYFRHV